MTFSSRIKHTFLLAHLPLSVALVGSCAAPTRREVPGRHLPIVRRPRLSPPGPHWMTSYMATC